MQVRIAGRPKQLAPPGNGRIQSHGAANGIPASDGGVAGDVVLEVATSMHAGKKSEEIIIGNADVVWSGSVHCG